MTLPPELQGALLDRRVVFLRGRLDQALASQVIGQLLLVSKLAAGQACELYIDSPGGELGAALSVYDVLRTLEAPVSTRCLGTAQGAAVAVLAGGAPGQRYALPHARLFLGFGEGFGDATGGAAGPGVDVVGLAAEAARQRARFRDCLAQHAAFSAARIERDLTAGRWLSAAEARDYGLVDGILPPLG
jgi:ATP-dependent Clp protease protease subunit